LPVIWWPFDLRQVSCGQVETQLINGLDNVKIV